MNISLFNKTHEENITLLSFRSSDGEDVVRRSVDVMFEKIHMLKFKTLETLGEVRTN